MESLKKEKGKLTDMHSHTYPSSHDGKNTLQEMIDEGLKKDLTYYGISNHFDYDYYAEEQCNGDEDEYFREARLLQHKYKDKINILVGAEFGFSERMDIQKQYLATYQKYRPDYIINSVHGYMGRDFARMILSGDKREIFSLYLNLVRKSLDVAYPYDIVGHIEYIVRYVPFEEKEIRVTEFQKEIDDILTAIIKKEKILEVNTSVKGLSRDCLPNDGILCRYYQLGGRKISFGSDAHTTERIAEGRAKVVALLKNIGFDYFTIPIKGRHEKFEF